MTISINMSDANSSPKTISTRKNFSLKPCLNELPRKKTLHAITPKHRPNTKKIRKLTGLSRWTRHSNIYR